MNYYDITGAIHRIAYKRLANGVAIETVVLHLNKLKKTTWKFNKNIQDFIDSVLLELENLQQTPEINLKTVRQYANKYLIDYPRDKAYNISSEQFKTMFSSCALPLNPRLYPMLRLEIFRILKEANL